MNPFLKQIAEHYIETAEDISRLVFVFPSHRASLFFKKYLGEQVQQRGTMPVFSPLNLSIDEFFSRFSSSEHADNLTLLLKLYGCYKEICNSRGVNCEPLDEFVFWGNVILADFDDIDKYDIDAAQILCNVSELKATGGDLSYLNERQEQAIRRFIGYFEKDGEYKLRFARLWNMLGELYEKFNESLHDDGLCYGGAMYRRIASDFEKQGAEQMFAEAFPGYDKVVFCGLNVLSTTEKKVLTRLRNLGLAEFCWDYCSPWIQDARNKSSLKMSENMADYPQAFELEKCETVPVIDVVEVPSGVGQVKVVSDMLLRGDIPADERTAVVLPDENLLQPMLNSLPPNVQKVNVTMGCSMTGSSFYTMMNDIAQLQMHIRCKDGKYMFYHRPLWSIVGNNVFDALLDEGERELLRGLKKQHRYYVDAEAFAGSAFLSLVLRPVVLDPKSNDAAQVHAIQAYQNEILQFVGKTIASDEDLKQRFSLELDYAMEYVKSVNLISSKDIAILPQTYFALLDNVLRSKSVPLKGEPLSGLQIMGPLETRALDFEHVFILNCNEGVFPHSEAVTSFIPPLLRKGFELPTYEYHDAVWAYYFYRMIQRPSHVRMLLDTRSEGLRSGEESRYIKQLEYSFGAKVGRFAASSAPSCVKDVSQVWKTPEHIAKIKGKRLSPTAIQDYLQCPMKFYFSYVLELRPDEEVAESMDAGIIGNVYHKVMESLYKGRSGNIITRKYLEEIRDNAALIRDIVERQTMKEMNSDSIIGRDIVVCTIICKYVRSTIQRDLEFMKNAKVDSFKILGLEEKLFGKFGGLEFKGTADRIDSFQPGTLRLVDYKTGKVLQNDWDIDDKNAASVASKIFAAPGNELDRPKIALQFFIYDMLLNQSDDVRFKDKTVSNVVYSTRSIMTRLPDVSYPNLSFNKAMEEKLKACIDEILSMEIPFERRPDDIFNDKTCEHCNFKAICGR